MNVEGGDRRIYKIADVASDRNRDFKMLAVFIGSEQ